MRARVRFGAAILVLLALGSTRFAEAQVVDAKFELFVSDPAASLAFYRVIGFELAHQKADGYTTLRSEGTVVALSPLPRWLPLWLGSAPRSSSTPTRSRRSARRSSPLDTPRVRSPSSRGAIATSASPTPTATTCA